MKTHPSKKILSPFKRLAGWDQQCCHHKKLKAVAIPADLSRITFDNKNVECCSFDEESVTFKITTDDGVFVVPLTEAANKVADKYVSDFSKESLFAAIDVVIFNASVELRLNLIHFATICGLPQPNRISMARTYFTLFLFFLIGSSFRPSQFALSVFTLASSVTGSAPDVRAASLIAMWLIFLECPQRHWSISCY